MLEQAKADYDVAVVPLYVQGPDGTFVELESRKATARTKAGKLAEAIFRTAWGAKAYAPVNNYDSTEKTYAAYIQPHYETSLSGMRLEGVFGGRLVRSQRTIAGAGMVGAGLARILRDNQALSRQSFLEFDLEAMFDGEPPYMSVSTSTPLPLAHQISSGGSSCSGLPSSCSTSSDSAHTDGGSSASRFFRPAEI